MIQYNTVWDFIYRTAVYQCCTLVSDCIGAHVRCPEAVSSDVWCEHSIDSPGTNQISLCPLSSHVITW